MSTYNQCKIKKVPKKRVVKSVKKYINHSKIGKDTRKKRFSSASDDNG